MSITLNGVELVECEDRPTRGHLSRRGQSAKQRFFLCDWGDLADAMEGLLGSVISVGGVIVSTDPEPFDVGSVFECQDVDFEGVGQRGVDANGYVQYEKALLTATYAPRELEDDEEDHDANDPWLTASMTFHDELYTVPDYALKWGDTGANLDHYAAVPVVVGSLTFTRHNIGSIMRSRWTRDLGKLNSAAWKGYPAYTLMYGGFDPRKVINMDGEVLSRSVTIGIKYRNVPWDYFFRRADGFQQAIKQDGTELFEYANFNLIGQPEE